MIRAFLILALLPALALGFTKLGTVYTTNGSQADVNAAIADASTDDTVNIPAGAFTWGASGLYTSINKRIKLLGAGPTATILTASTSAPSGNGGVIRLTGGAAGAEIGNFRWNGATSGNTATLFNVYQTQNFRIRDVRYDGTGARANFMYSTGGAVGVIYECHITVGRGTEETIFTHGPSDAWSRPWTDFGGTGNMIYVEDCTFDGIPGTSGYVCDLNNYGVGCFRNNTIDTALKIDGHGYASNSSRGVRFMEVYRNRWTYTSTSVGSFRAVEHRGGGGIYWGNVIDSSNSSIGSYRLTDYGYTGQWSNFSRIYQTAFRWPIPDQIGAGPGTVVPNGSGTQVGGAEPLLFFGNLKGGVRAAPNIPAVSAVTSIRTNAAGYSAGVSSITVTGANSSIQAAAGNYFSLPGDTTRYLITSGTAVSPGSITFTPALVNAVPAAATTLGFGPLTNQQGLTGNPAATLLSSDIIRSGRDYWRDVDSFDGSSGIGTGTKAQMLAITPIAIVYFWVTDEADWDSVQSGPDGQLYRWNGSAWLLHYTPYPYPHPLRDTGPDVTAPIATATIQPSGTTLAIALSEACTAGTGGTGGVTLSATGGPVTATYTSGNGTSQWLYHLDRTIIGTETVTWSYATANGIEDAAGNDLAAVTAAAVTNTSTETVINAEPNPWRSAVVPGVF